MKLNNYSSLVDLLIKDECAGKPQHERLLLLGDTPEYLIQYAGFPQLTIAIKASVISKACFDHGISTSLLKNLPEIITQPKCVFQPVDTVTHSDTVVVLTFEVKGSSPIIIPVRQNGQVGRGNYFNLISSVYGKEGENPEVKWKKSGLLLWEP